MHAEGGIWHFATNSREICEGSSRGLSGEVMTDRWVGKGLPPRGVGRVEGVAQQKWVAVYMMGVRFFLGRVKM